MKTNTTGPQVHLIVGATGAGKTTYAMQLAESLGAVRFSIDPWMQELYGADWPELVSYQWALERVQRCEDHGLELCRQLVGMNLEVIFDFGFFKQDQRSKVRDFCTALGAQVKIHYLDIDPETRWQRVCQRNEEKGGTFALKVTKEQFDFCEGLFEIPESWELAV